MISYLRGKVIELGKNYVILDVNGVGYRVYMPLKALGSISKSDSRINLFTKTLFDQHERIFEIYGFPVSQDLETFELLTSVSGIGPKNALNIMSSLKIEELMAAVSKENTDYLRKVSGLGPKTAKRLVMELRDKMNQTQLAKFAQLDLTKDIDTIDALVFLGYSKEVSLDALRKVSKKAVTLESKVKEALKILSGQK